MSELYRIDYHYNKSLGEEALAFASKAAARRWLCKHPDFINDYENPAPGNEHDYPSIMDFVISREGDDWDYSLIALTIIKDVDS